MPTPPRPRAAAGRKTAGTFPPRPSAAPSQSPVPSPQSPVPRAERAPTSPHRLPRPGGVGVLAVPPRRRPTMPDFCHLHCHTQYSLLDGAARIERLVNRAAQLDHVAVAITDHGNLHGVPELYTKAQARRRPAHRRVRVLRHALRHGRHPGPDALPPGAPGEEPGGLPEPHRALVAELHRRVLLQAPRRPRDAPPAQRGLGRDHVLPPGRGPPDDPEARRGRGAARVRGLPRHVRRRLLHRGPGPRDPRPADVQRRPHAVGRGVRRDRRGHERRPLRGPGRRRGPGRAVVPPDGEGPPRPEPDAVRERPVLPQERRRDAARVRAVGPRRRVQDGGRRRRGARRDARDRRQVPAGDPDGRAPDAALPHPARALRAGRLPPRALVRGRPAALPRDLRDRPRAAGPGAGRDRGDGLRGLLPHRPGLHDGGPRHGRERGAGPRVGRGVGGRVLPRDHEHRPAPVRPPLRALPEPGARVDARHRHRLRRPRAGQGHRLRRREVRAGVGLPDRDVRDDGLEVRHPRRLARARRAAPRGRPDRQAHPGRRQGDAREGEGRGARVRQTLRARRPPDPQAHALRDGPGGERAAHGRPRGRRHHRAGRREPVRPRVDPEGQGRGGGRGRHAVRRAVGRGVRAAQDGLFGVEDPHHLGRRAGPHPRKPRSRDRPRRAAPRRPRHVQALPARRHGRHLPVRVVGDARVDAEAEADDARRPHCDERALPAGADGPHPDLHRPEARARAGRVPAPDARGHPGPDLRHPGLPGAGDADGPGHGRLLAGRSGPPASGDGQEGHAEDGEGAGHVRRRRGREGGRQEEGERGLRHDGQVCRLRI